MPRTGENIHKRADGRWEGRFTKGKVGNKYIRSSVYGKTYTEAKMKLTKAKSEYYSGFDDADYQEFLEWKAFREEYREFMAWKAMKDREAAESVSGVTEISGLSETSGTAKLSKDLRLPGMPGRTRRTGNLAEPARTNLENYLFADIDPLKLGVLLCLYCGLRVGELSALKWGDMDLGNRTLHINSTIQRVKADEGQKKTKLAVVEPKFRSAIRDVSIPEKICSIIPQLQKEGDCFVLTGTDQFMDPRTVENRFDRMMVECGINGITIEACRRAYKMGG